MTGYLPSWLALSVSQPAFPETARYDRFLVEHANIQEHRIKFALHVHRFGWMAISHQRIIRQRRADFLALAARHARRAKYSAGNLAEIYMNPAESASLALQS